MRAMMLPRPGQPLEPAEIPVPSPGPEEAVLRVSTCAVCRTDLHVVDGELPSPKLPLIPGHEVVGRVVATGAGVTEWEIGARVGVGWLASTCGTCRHCRAGAENLCPSARFNGYTCDGGYAEYMRARAGYCFRLPERYGDREAAPLLCAGVIGYRCLRRAGHRSRLGLFGFGAAAHLITQVAVSQGTPRVFAFTRPGDRERQDFARRLGACWAGDSTSEPPEELDAAIIFAPDGALVPQALKVVGPGGRVVCGGIHMSPIPAMPYERLWRERSVTSVANLRRVDSHDFLAVAANSTLDVKTRTFPLAAANEALTCLRSGRVEGAIVLVP